jgi:endoglycosylceramidase
MPFISIFLLLIGLSSQSKFVNVNPFTNKFMDEQGRERYYHGLNVVVKVFPYIPWGDKFDTDKSFSAKDMEYFNSWGLNIVRLSIM